MFMSKKKCKTLAYIVLVATSLVALYHGITNSEQHFEGKTFYTELQVQTKETSEVQPYGILIHCNWL